jgi:hypothetical protein
MTTEYIDPFPGKPTVYPYYDPNDATHYANKDPNSSGALDEQATSSTYIWAYMSGTVDTTANVTTAPGSQQASLQALRFKDGSIPSGAASVAAPINKHQLEAPSVGGYYDSADTANTNPQPW